MSSAAPSWVVQLVNELVNWYEREETSNPLSYPSTTCEARILESPGRPEGKRLARSLVPTCQLPAHLAPVDRAIATMPDGMRTAVIHRHLGTIDSWQRETQLSRATYYKQLDAAYWYITGVVNAELDRR